jgi:hypothetical protein
MLGLSGFTPMLRRFAAVLNRQVVSSKQTKGRLRRPR